MFTRTIIRIISTKKANKCLKQTNVLNISTEKRTKVLILYKIYVSINQLIKTPHFYPFLDVLSNKTTKKV